MFDYLLTKRRFLSKENRGGAEAAPARKHIFNTKCLEKAESGKLSVLTLDFHDLYG